MGITAQESRGWYRREGPVPGRHQQGLELGEEGDGRAGSLERLSEKSGARAEPWGVNQIVSWSTGGLVEQAAVHREAQREKPASGWRNRWRIV